MTLNDLIDPKPAASAGGLGLARYQAVMTPQTPTAGASPIERYTQIQQERPESPIERYRRMQPQTAAAVETPERMPAGAAGAGHPATEFAARGLAAVPSAPTTSEQAKPPMQQPEQPPSGLERFRAMQPKPREAVQAQPGGPSPADIIKAKYAGDLEAGWNVGVKSMQSLGAGAVGALGQAVGSDSMREWGVGHMERLEREMQPWMAGRPTKLEDIKGVGDAADWAQFTVAQVAPSILESIGAALVGGALGSAAAPGAGTAVGAIGGAAAKGAVKGALSKYLAKATSEGMLRGATREAAEQAAKRTVGAQAGAAIGMFGSSYLQGVGDVYGETLGDDKRGDLLSSFALAVPYAALDSVVEMGVLGKIMKGSPGEEALKRYTRAILGTAAQEGSTEAAQEALVLLAGVKNDQEYSSEEVLSRLGNGFAAGFLAGGVMGAPAGRAQREQVGFGDLVVDVLPGGEDPVNGMARPELRTALTDPSMPDPVRARAFAAVTAALEGLDPVMGAAFKDVAAEALARRTTAVPTDAFMTAMTGGRRAGEVEPDAAGADVVQGEASGLGGVTDPGPSALAEQVRAAREAQWAEEDAARAAADGQPDDLGGDAFLRRQAEATDPVNPLMAGAPKPPNIDEVQWTPEPLDSQMVEGRGGLWTREVQRSADGAWVLERAITPDGELARERVQPFEGWAQNKRAGIDAAEESARAQVRRWRVENPNTPEPKEMADELSELRAQRRWLEGVERAGKTPAVGDEVAEIRERQTELYRKALAGERVSKAVAEAPETAWLRERFAGAEEAPTAEAIGAALREYQPDGGQADEFGQSGVGSGSGSVGAVGEIIDGGLRDGGLRDGGADRGGALPGDEAEALAPGAQGLPTKQAEGQGAAESAELLTPERRAFVPTHVLSDGTPVEAVAGESNVYRDASGIEIEDDYAELAQQPMGAPEPTGASARESGALAEAAAAEPGAGRGAVEPAGAGGRAVGAGEPVSGADDAPALTAEAAEVLKTVEEGGLPFARTRNLERIAAENGVEVTPETTPVQIVEGLRERAQAPETRSDEAIAAEPTPPERNPISDSPAILARYQDQPSGTEARVVRLDDGRFSSILWDSDSENPVGGGTVFDTQEKADAHARKLIPQPTSNPDQLPEAPKPAATPDSAAAWDAASTTDAEGVKQRIGWLRQAGLRGAGLGKAAWGDMTPEQQGALAGAMKPAEQPSGNSGALESVRQGEPGVVDDGAGQVVDALPGEQARAADATPWAGEQPGAGIQPQGVVGAGAAAPGPDVAVAESAGAASPELRPGGVEANDAGEARIAGRYAALFGETYGAERAISPERARKQAAALARAIREKDAYALGVSGQNLIDSKANPVARRIFEEETGVTLPKQQSGSWKAIRAWAGVSDAQDQVHSAKKAADQARARLSESRKLTNGVEWVDTQVAAGFDELVQADGKWLLRNPKTNQQFNLTNMVGAAEARPYLRSAIALRQAEKLAEQEANNAPNIPTNPEVRAAGQSPSAVAGASVPATGSAVATADAGQEAGVVAPAGVDAAQPTETRAPAVGEGATLPDQKGRFKYRVASVQPEQQGGYVRIERARKSGNPVTNIWTAVTDDGGNQQLSREYVLKTFGVRAVHRGDDLRGTGVGDEIRQQRETDALAARQQQAREKAAADNLSDRAQMALRDLMLGRPETVRKDVARGNLTADEAMTLVERLEADNALAGGNWAAEKARQQIELGRADATTHMDATPTVAGQPAGTGRGAAADGRDAGAADRTPGETRLLAKLDEDIAKAQVLLDAKDPAKRTGTLIDAIKAMGYNDVQADVLSRQTKQQLKDQLNALGERRRKMFGVVADDRPDQSGIAQAIASDVRQAMSPNTQIRAEVGRQAERFKARMAKLEADLIGALETTDKEKIEQAVKQSFKDGKVVFDIPGDGRFKVSATPERIDWFVGQIDKATRKSGKQGAPKVSAGRPVGQFLAELEATKNPEDYANAIAIREARGLPTEGMDATLKAKQAAWDKRMRHPGGWLIPEEGDRVIQVHGGSKGAEGMVENKKRKGRSEQLVFVSDQGYTSPMYQYPSGMLRVLGDEFPYNQEIPKEPEAAKEPAKAEVKVEPEKAPEPVRVEKAAEPAKPVKKQEVIENFGEALPPARRALARRLSEDLTDETIAAEPLSKIWPLSENEAIEDPFAAVVAHVARASIPPKPRGTHKLRNWVAQVKTVRTLASLIMDGSVTREEFLARAELRGRALEGFRAKIKLLEKLDREHWKRVGEVAEYPTAYRFGPSPENKQIPAPYATATIDKRRNMFQSGDITDHLDAINAQLDGSAPELKLKFEIRTNRRTGTTFINKAGDKEMRHVMEFETVEAARDAIANKHDELVAAWDGIKARDNITERDLRRAENKPRAAEDWRKGRDVAPEEFQAKFSFKGVEFGKWVSQGKGEQERQFLLNSVYDALMDLADILGVPPDALSLNGTLGLALGSRGSGWASAHFEPSNLVINLTKPRGAGSLAHEFFHALDNYFARQRRGGEESPFTGDQDGYRRENYITHAPERMMVQAEGAITRAGRMAPMTAARLEYLRKANPTARQFDAVNWIPDPNHPQGVRPEVEERFAALVKALNASPMKARAQTLEKSGDYWSRTLEMAARAFENFVIARMMAKGYQNDFLANVVAPKEMTKSLARYPYLFPEEIAPIAEAFDDLFSTIQVRKEGGRSVLFSKTDAQPQTKPVRQALQQSFSPAMQRTLRRMLGRGERGAAGGLVVLSGSAAERAATFAKATGRRLGGAAARALAEGRAQGAFDPKTGLLFVAGDLDPETAVAVLLHEATHGQRRPALDARVQALLAGDVPVPKETRAFLDRVRARMARAGESGAQGEALAYVVEAAALEGQKAGFSAIDGAFLSWVDGTLGQPIGDLLRRFVAQLRAWALRLGLPMNPAVDDLLALARGDLKRAARGQVVVEADVRDPRYSLRDGLPATIDVDGTERPTTNSEGRLIHPTEAGVRNFWRWFGDSKVVDGEGRPLVVYHFTDSDTFDVFDRDKLGINTESNTDQEQAVKMAKLGFWFSDTDIRYTPERGRGMFADNQMDVFVSLKNPKIFGTFEDMWNESEQHESAEDWKTWLEIDEHDGVIIKNDTELGGTSYVAFNQEQIKSTDNTGAFSETDPDIRYSLAPASDRGGSPLGGGRTLQESIKAFTAEPGAWSRDKWLKSLPTVLGAVTLRQLADLGEARLPGINAYNAVRQRMETRRNEMVEQSGQFAEEVWQRWAGKRENKAEAAELNDFIHRATLDQVDPDRYETLKITVQLGPEALFKRVREATQANVDELNKRARQLVRSKKLEDKGLAPYYQMAAKQLALAVRAEQRRLAKLPELAKRWAALSDGQVFRKEDGSAYASEADAQRAIDTRKDLQGKVLYAEQADGGWVIQEAGAKQIYRRARDLYKQRGDEMMEALIARVAESRALDEVNKRALAAKIRAEFEQTMDEKGNPRVGPYFPLQRFGRFYTAARRFPTGTARTFRKMDGGTFASESAARSAIGRRADLREVDVKPVELKDGSGWVLEELGEPGFWMYEDTTEQRRDAMRLQAEGWTSLKQGLTQEAGKQGAEAVSEGFMAQAVKQLQDRGATDEADMLYQMYLQTLNQMSIRKHFIHRKGTAGYSDNALRSFGWNMTRLAHQVSKLEYVPALERMMTDIEEGKKDRRNATPDADIRVEDAFFQELQKRHQWVVSPNNASWTNFTSALGFFWYLGVTPGAALVNLTQTPIVGLPVLAARFKWGSSARALGQAAVDVMRGFNPTVAKGFMTGTPRPSQAANLSADEQAAFDAWSVSGVRDRTRAHNLAGIGDTDAFWNGPTFNKGMAIVSSLFHAGEVVNRDVTLLAGYRLARKAGQSHAAAVKVAEDMTWQSHFDYGNQNRARFMQGNLAKVILMFRSYSQHVTYFMWRNLYQWTKGETPEVRAEARTKFLGLMGMTALFAGSAGLPMFWLAFALANAMASLFGDDDEPWDAEIEWRRWLAQTFPSTVGDILDRGVANTATGLDWSTRVSLRELWFRSPDRDLDGAGMKAHIVEWILGPMGGIAFSPLTAADMIADGHWDRAAEAVVPKFLRDALKAGRYASEGVQTLRGDPVLESLSPYELIWTAMGMQPDALRVQWDNNNAIKKYEGRILDRRSRLMTAAALAMIHGDREGLANVTPKIERFNQAQPTIPITMQSLRTSVRNRIRYSEQAEGGIAVNPRLEHLREVASG